VIAVFSDALLIADVLIGNSVGALGLVLCWLTYAFGLLNLDSCRYFDKGLFMRFFTCVEAFTVAVTLSGCVGTFTDH
jgi:hypothetical protein